MPKPAPAPPAEATPPGAPKPLDEAALESVNGGKLVFDDGVTTFWDPATGQVTTTRP
ncbi:hypothetical protein [Falsiroseomonas sp. CW058]|uniref:hypothetical protein n=1 Tax=Falsiroseomonas sp. CW058 TaxID=3388664 RepID=UPI003D313556